MSLLPVGETILIAMGISAGFVSIIVFVLWLRHFRTTWQERLNRRRPQRSLSEKDDELTKRYSVASTFGKPRETPTPTLPQSQNARSWKSQHKPQQRPIINDTNEGTAHSGDSMELDSPSNERYLAEPSNIHILFSPAEIEEAKTDFKVIGLEICDTAKSEQIQNKHGGGLEMTPSSLDEDALLLSQWKQRISDRSEQLQHFLKMTAATKSAMKSGARSIDGSAVLEDPRKSAPKDDDEVGCLGIGPLCFCA